MTEELKQKGIKFACEYPSSQELGYKRLGYKRVDLRKAYIAGAIENGIVWHDLRKNPKDLPEERKDVLILYTDMSADIKHLEWNKEWWRNGTYCAFDGVIKWAEIPI